MSNKEEKSRDELTNYKELVSDLHSFRPLSGSFKSEFEGEENIIKGDALGVGTWNQIYYGKKELKQAAESLKGVPLVIGHGKKKSDEIGEVLNSSWNENKEVIEFTAQIDSDDVANMVKHGVVDSVSVGVEFDDIMTDNGKSAANLDFYELALVNEPAFLDGIHEIIEKKAEEDNELSNRIEGDDELMNKEDNKVIIPVSRSTYDELADKDNVSVKGSFYPGPAGYYPSLIGGKYGYPSYGYPSKYGYPYRYPYGYPKTKLGNEREEEGYGYPYSPIFSILERIKRLEDEVGITYGEPDEKEEKVENMIAIATDEKTAKEITENEVNSYDQEIEKIDRRIKELERELGFEKDE